MTKFDRTQWKSAAPFAAAVAVMLFAGWKQGVWSERWVTSPELQMFADQLKEIPSEFGEWKGTDNEQSSDAVRKIAGFEGELIRTYKNPAGEEVRVSLICARLQDIFDHNPERCYPAAGFEMEIAPQRTSFEVAGKPEFFTTTFLKSEPTGVHSERGFWSWSGDGTWVAPDNPKLRFGSQQWALYKLYVFANAPPAKQRTVDRDYCREFIEAFVPVLDTALRPVFFRTNRIKTEESAEPAVGATQSDT